MKIKLNPDPEVRDGCRWKTCGDSDRIASWGYADRPSAGWTRGGRDPGGLSGKPAWVKKWFIVLRVNHNREI